MKMDAGVKHHGDACMDGERRRLGGRGGKMGQGGAAARVPNSALERGRMVRRRREEAITGERRGRC